MHLECILYLLLVAYICNSVMHSLPSSVVRQHDGVAISVITARVMMKYTC